jgi:hypothetical protein
MNKFYKISVFISLLLIFSPIILHAQNDVDFIGVKLFETGYDAVPQSERVYSTHFSKSNTRYIFYEAEVRNNLYNVRSNTVKIYAEYYKADESLFGDPAFEYTIPSDWSTAYLWQGWGWNEPGNWETGRYKVVLFIAGKRLTEIYFTIL